MASSSTLYLLVGTYTLGTSRGIYVYTFDQETGTSGYVSEAIAVNPSYLAISADEHYLYAVSESNGEEALVYVFSFDKEHGKLNLLNTQFTNGAGPCYISTDPTGSFAVTANYSDGSVSVLPIATDGSLLPVEQIFEFFGSGLDAKRQSKPHLHSVVFSPDQRFLFAADLGTDQLYKFTTSHTSPFLTVGNPRACSLEPGSGPRHLLFHPNGKYGYLINELSGKVTVFHYEDGHLDPVQYIPSDLSEGEGGKGSGDIQLSPDGKFLYASNRAHTNNIAIFAIDNADGTLTLVGHQSTALHPRSFVITPNGKYLLVANMNSHLIQVFEVDRVTGLLREEQSKQISAIDRPVCVKLIFL